MRDVIMAILFIVAVCLSFRECWHAERCKRRGGLAVMEYGQWGITCVKKDEVAP